MNLRLLIPLEITRRPPALGRELQWLTGEAMGTRWQVRLAVAPRLPLAGVRQAVADEIAQVVQEMSHWDAGSQLNAYNRAPAGSWQAIAPGFAQAMACALAVAERSGGAFDPAAGAHIDAWGFGPGNPYLQPGFVPVPLPEAGSAADTDHDTGRGAEPTAAPWQRLQLDLPGLRLWQPGGLRLNLSAVAKGQAVDRVTERLRAAGLDDVLVEIGGELRGHGLRPDGQPWWVDIAAADGGPVRTRVALHGLAVATSGDAERRYIGADGRLRSHTLDPRTGAPVAHDLASVSVLHPECMWADAWSTALLVAGLDDGLALAEREGLAALLVRRRPDGQLEEHASTALQALAD